MKSKMIITLIIVVSFGCFFYFMDSKRESDLNRLNEESKYIKGIVIQKTVYKGRHIRVKYVIDNKQYIESAGYDENDVIKLGDSISIRYSTGNPKLMITQFDENY
ncbi:MAG: hypothetical protein EOO45_20725 [Flavobacterium sp.]|nr:MAG: hypothetical protein EOO45_20725 [Flavobacterium sp.]